jgi:hypothetical protein
VSDERYAAGRVVLFASDPNFRAFTDGTRKILRNAVLGADPATAATSTTAARTAATASAEQVADLGGDLLVTVRPAVADRAAALLSSYGLTLTRTGAAGGVRLRVAGFGSTDRNGLPGPGARPAGAGERGGVRPAAVSVPARRF